MTDRDRAVLELVHDSRFLTGQQLIRTFWQTADATTPEARLGRRALKRLTDWRVLETLPRRVGGMRSGSGALVYYVGLAGVRLLAARGITAPHVTVPGTLHLAHTLATGELALRLREADRESALELIEVQREPQCWRGYVGPGMSRRVLKPDLFLRIGAGGLEDRWMVEVDLATESGRVIARKAYRYLEYFRDGSEQRNHGTYPRVLWSVPDLRRGDQIADVLAKQPAEGQRLFSICVSDNVPSFLASEART
jgi:hypothetical protein